MSSDEFRLDDYIAHILDAVSKIQSYTCDGRDEFFNSSLETGRTVLGAERA